MTTARKAIGIAARAIGAPESDLVRFSKAIFVALILVAVAAVSKAVRAGTI